MAAPVFQHVEVEAADCADAARRFGLERHLGKLRDVEVVADQHDPVADAHLTGARQAGDLGEDLVAIRIDDLADAELDLIGGVRDGDGLERRDLRVAVGRSRVEVERRGAQRAEDERFLPALRRLHHVVADAAEEQAEFQAGHVEVLQQGVGVGAVVAETVLGQRVGAGRQRYQRIAGRVVDPGEAGGNVAFPDGAGIAARQAVGEGIVPAGVEDQDAQFPRLRQFSHDQVERHRLVDQVAFAFQPRVGGQKVVLAAHLKAMAGIEHHRDIGGGGTHAEIAEVTGESPVVEIEDLLDFEVEFPQCRTDGAGVVRRIGQFGRVFVAPDADHQGNALVAVRSKSGVGQASHQHQRKQEPENSHQPEFPTVANRPAQSGPQALGEQEGRRQAIRTDYNAGRGRGDRAQK